MAEAFENTKLLKEDVLGRAGESPTTSTYQDQVIRDLNRVYRTLCAGASEFLPEYIDDWWWMRSKGILTLLPATTGSVTVTQDSANITFGASIATSVVGYAIRTENHSELFRIATHTGGTAVATLDSPYTGASGNPTYRLMKTYYTLDPAVNALMSPMVGFRGISIIPGVTPDRMDEQYPLYNLQPGIPQAFSLENNSTVRFSHGGLMTGQSMRVEYRYRAQVVGLTDSASSVPLVPLEWRHLLSDMALTYLLLIKNDDRSNAIALSARTGLAAMLKENRRRLTKMGGSATGKIYPRLCSAQQSNGNLLRTETGLIIGGP